MTNLEIFPWIFLWKRMPKSLEPTGGTRNQKNTKKPGNGTRWRTKLQEVEVVRSAAFDFRPSVTRCPGDNHTIIAKYPRVRTSESVEATDMGRLLIFICGGVVGSAALCYHLYTRKSAEADRLKHEISRMQENIRKKRMLILKAASATAVAIVVIVKVRSIYSRIISHSKSS
jgi:hypothetical protein